MMEDKTWYIREGCRHEGCDHQITPVRPGQVVIMRFHQAGFHVTADGTCHKNFVQIVEKSTTGTKR